MKERNVYGELNIKYYTGQSLKAKGSNSSNLVPLEHVPPIIIESSKNRRLSLRSQDR